MTVITEREFTNNIAKYLDMAETESVVITRGKKKLEIGTKKQLISDEDIANALTIDEAKTAIEPRIRAMFENHTAAHHLHP